jgi:hypothetical protein
MKDTQLYHHGVLGMKWGVRRYQNKDGSLTDAGRKRIYKAVKRYAKAESRARTQDAHMKAENQLEDSLRTYTKLCKEAIDKQRLALNRKFDYERPYLDEWGRLNDVYLSKHKSVYSVDYIPAKDSEAIKRQAAKKVGYDKKEYERLKSDFLKASNNAERECQKVSEYLLGKYGDTTMLNAGYANEETAKDIVSYTLKNMVWYDYRKQDVESRINGRT